MILHALKAAALLVPADDKPDASKKLQGKRVATAMRHGDTETPKEDIEKGAVTLSVDGDRFVFATPKEKHEGTLVLGDEGKERTLDLKIETKKGEKKTILRIYEWDGDTLRIAGDQEKRPKDCKSKLGGAIVVTLKKK
ncbi:MAG: TIGR03067 domain-containing protein [Gemmataceae bacterium]|nr:TIGR03067 domain-containing protein [Gemmataceae bacterium]